MFYKVNAPNSWFSLEHGLTILDEASRVKKMVDCFMYYAYEAQNEADWLDIQQKWKVQACWLELLKKLRTNC